MEMESYQIAGPNGLCFKCKKHVMKDCECFFGRLFINDQPERLNPETYEDEPLKMTPMQIDAALAVMLTL